MLRSRYNKARYTITKKVPLPKTFYLVINSKCNARCMMCDIGNKNRGTQFYEVMNKRTEWSMDQFEGFIDDVKQYATTISITSTEPLLHKNIIDMIQYTKEVDLRCNITTNGYLLPKYAKELCDVKLDRISISLDALPELHNKIRRTDGLWEKAWAGIIQIQREDNRPHIEIDTVITPMNQDKLYELAVLIKEMCDVHIINHMNFVTEGMVEGTDMPCTASSVSHVNPKEIDEVVLYTELLRIQNINSNIIVSPNLKTIPEIEKYYKTYQFLKGCDTCKAMWSVGQILANGEVGVSTRCYNLSFGNINTESFKDIWNGDKFNKFRRYITDTKPIACARCCGVF